MHFLVQITPNQDSFDVHHTKSYDMTYCNNWDNQLIIHVRGDSFFIYFFKRFCKIHAIPNKIAEYLIST
jgi:hypothetical protein